MSFFSLFRKKPVQPDLQYAAKGFTPVIAAQLAGKDLDLYELADGFANALLRDGCPHHLATAARWGGVTAIGQDLGLYSGFLSDYEEVAAAEGIDTRSKEQQQAKYHSASLMMVTLVMADAPAEYDRFLKYIGSNR